MNASCQKLLPLYTPEIYDQVIDLPVEKPPLIFISEKEYLELKSEVGYWQAMHQKAISDCGLRDGLDWIAGRDVP
jgi:transposase